MSWDVILFNSRQKINFIEELDDTQLESTNFCSALENHFAQITKSDDHRVIKGKDFAIDYFEDDENVSNKLLSLYGENGLYELVVVAKKYNWQIFDTGLGQMIDLENPSNNGFENFQDYLKQLLNDKQ